MNYNKPAIPKGTCNKFCYSHLLYIDSQQVIPYYTLATLGSFALFYALISVYLGTFGLF